MALVVDNLKTNSITLSGTPLINFYQTGSGYCSTLRTGVGSYANGCYSVVSGGRYNTTQARYSTVGGGRYNESGIIGGVDGWGSVQYNGSLNTGGWFGPYSPTSASTINGSGVQFEFYFYGGGGVSLNLVSRGSEYVDGDVLVFNGNLFPSGTTSADTITITIGSGDFGYATVSGGRSNTASGEYSTVGGGHDNTASGYNSTISGGYNNTALDDYTTISGGYQNIAVCRYATVSGGYRNTALGSYSTISGGYQNTTTDRCSTISGGYYNTVSSEYGGILGGRYNCVNHDCSFAIGANISTVAQCTLHINCLHFSSIPTSAVGLCPGTVWNDSGKLCIV